MRTRPRSLLVSCLTAAIAAFAAAAVPVATAGTVSVSFVNEARFADAGTTPWEASANLAALAGHLKALGQRHLPADHSLKLELLDVDLAGTTRPSRHVGRDLRVVKGLADWPRIGVRYVLEAPGKPSLSGEETVADLNYARHLPADRGSDPLHFEKRMLEAWFKARIVERRAAGD